MALDFGKLDFAVAFDRLTAFPLDAKSYFESYESAAAAAATAEAAGSSKTTYYFGQTIAVVESGIATLYIIQPDKTLKQVGAEVILDENVFVKAEDGTISLKEFAGAVAGAQLTKGEDGSVKWVKPDTTTVEGLSTAVKSLQDTVGDSSKGLVKDVADLKTSVGATTDVANADGSVYARIKQNAADISTLESKMTAVFHFKGAAPDGQLSNVTEKEVGDVYTVGDKEYVWDGTNWTELGFTTDLGAYSTTEEMNTAIATAKSEANTYADSLVGADSAISKRIATAEGKITTAEGDIDAVEAKLAGIDTTVTAYVEGKETTTNAAIKKNTDAITKLNADATTDGSVDYKIAAAKTALTAEIDKKATKATTLAGYGIADAYTQEQIDNKLSGKQDNVTFDGTYNASSNKAATVSTVTSAISGVKGTVDDGKDAETIAGAKAYAKDAAAAAESNAKNYADGLVGDSSAIAGRVTALEGKVDVDKVSTAIGTAKSDLIGTTADTADKDTIKGVKKYADDKVATVNGTVTDLTSRVTANETAITKLNGADSVEGSVDYKVKAAKDALTTEIGKKQDIITSATDLFVNSLLSGDAIFGQVALQESSISLWAPSADSANAVIKVSDENDNSDALLFSNGNDENIRLTGIKAPVDDIDAANKKYVDDQVNAVFSGLSGAMHFKGKFDVLPDPSEYDLGDVVIVGQKEYVLVIPTDSGNTWNLLGDEGSYAVKGSITNADIAANAAIAQSKIDGLTTALDSKLNSATAASTYVAKATGKSLIDDTLITKLEGIDTGAQVNKIESIKINDTLLTITDKAVNIPAASDSAFGVIKVDNTSIKSTNGTIAIKAVSTDLLAQGTETLVLNCGGAND